MLVLDFRPRAGSKSSRYDRPVPVILALARIQNDALDTLIDELNHERFKCSSTRVYLLTAYCQVNY